MTNRTVILLALAVTLATACKREEPAAPAEPAAASTTAPADTANPVDATAVVDNTPAADAATVFGERAGGHGRAKNARERGAEQMVAQHEKASLPVTDTRTPEASHPTSVRTG